MRILENKITGTDPKQIFDTIKNSSKNNDRPEDLQTSISKELSRLLKMSVGVSVVPIAEIPQKESTFREIHAYSDPSAVFEDNLYYYRIWVSESPEFADLQ